MGTAGTLPLRDSRGRCQEGALTFSGQQGGGHHGNHDTRQTGPGVQNFQLRVREQEGIPPCPRAPGLSGRGLWCLDGPAKWGLFPHQRR